MADAVVTVLQDNPPRPNLPSFVPNRRLEVVFDGVGDTSEYIDTRGFKLTDLDWTAMAATLTFLVAHKHDGTYVERAGVSYDMTAAGADGTSLLAGYDFVKLKQDTPVAGTVGVSLI